MPKDTDWSTHGPRLLEIVERVCSDSVETFEILRNGEVAVVVEGSTRFAHERDVKRILTELRAAIAAAKGQPT